ncbi:MAG: hypothetical protein ABSG57_07790 [Candidatus Bathyarchaeia archaeon]
MPYEEDRNLKSAQQQKTTTMLWLCNVLYLVLLYYVPFLAVSIFLVYAKKSRNLRSKDWFRKRLNILVIFRQILLFLLPLMFSLILDLILGTSFTIEQLPTLVALGLSITVFWVVELPLLTKVDIFVTFGVDDGNAIAEEDYVDKVVLDPEKENIVNTRVQNLGFTTLKNVAVEIYFGDGFEVVPSDDPKYTRLDFPRKFSRQKTHCGVVFAPSDNFQTIPPQEVFVFQNIVRTPKNMQKGMVTVYVFSENSWGMKEIKAPIEIKKK